jgi:hypothetical protein
MKKLFALVCALMLVSVTASAQELSKEDREKGVKYLEETRDGVVAAVSGLSDAQMHFKAGPRPRCGCGGFVPDDRLRGHLLASAGKQAARLRSWEFWTATTHCMTPCALH